MVSQVQGISMHKMFVSKARPSVSFSSTQCTEGDQIDTSKWKHQGRQSPLPHLLVFYHTVLEFLSSPVFQYSFLLVWKCLNTIKWFQIQHLKNVIKTTTRIFLHSFPNKFEFFFLMVSGHGVYAWNPRA